MKEEDRKLLNKLKKALRTSSKLSEDECNDSCIFGKKGKIYSDGAHWYIFFYGTRHWNGIKKKLAWMELWQNGDNEGVLRSKAFPTMHQATNIRKLVGLGKKRILSEEQKQALILKGSGYRFSAMSNGVKD